MLVANEVCIFEKYSEQAEINKTKLDYKLLFMISLVLTKFGRMMISNTYIVLMMW